jgi:hypothetical protein
LLLAARPFDRGQRQEAHHIGDRNPKSVNQMHIGLVGAACTATKGNVGPIRPMSKLILVVIEALMVQPDHKNPKRWSRMVLYMSKERSGLGDDEL